MEKEEKLICGECGAVIRHGDKLTAESPFDPEDIVIGCPECRMIDTLIRLCDRPGCTNSAVFGKPSGTDYIFVCNKHHDWPEDGDE